METVPSTRASLCGSPAGNSARPHPQKDVVPQLLQSSGVPGVVDSVLLEASWHDVFLPTLPGAGLPSERHAIKACDVMSGCHGVYMCAASLPYVCNGHGMDACMSMCV